MRINSLHLRNRLPFWMVASFFFFSFPAIFATTHSKIPKPEVTTIVKGASTKAYKYIFKNGLTLIVVPDNRNPLASLQFMLDAGSNREKLGTTGLAHYFEHNMFRKAEGAPEGNYDRVLNSVGGIGNAGTSDAFVTFYSTFPSPAIETMLKLESDRFKHLDIVEPFFSIEKGAVISERKLRVENNPQQRGVEALKAMTERGTPMEWMTIGAKADVENMTLNSVKEFYKTFYTPDNTIILLGGPFTPEQGYELISKYFSDWQGKLGAKHQPYPADYFTRNNGKSFVCSAPMEVQKFSLVYPASGIKIENMVYLSLLKAMLNDNKEGTFTRRLIKNKLATGFDMSNLFWQDQSNPFMINFSLNKSQSIEKATAFWFENFHNILKTKLSSKIIKQVMKQTAVANADTAERMTNLASSILDDLYFFHDFHASQKADTILSQVTDTKFKSWLQKSFPEKGFYTTGIVPTGMATPCSETHL